MESVRLKVHEHMASVGEEIVYVLEERTTTTSTQAIVKAFVLERLSAAAAVMCSLFLREMVTLETLLEKQNKLLDAMLQPRVTLHRADLLHLPVCREEVSAEQPPPPQIKYEQEELLHRPMEAEASTQTLLAVKSEDDESDTSTQQHMETQADVEYCGTSQPFSNGQLLSSHSSESYTEDSDSSHSFSDSSHSSASDTEDRQEIREDQSTLKSLKSQRVGGKRSSLRPDIRSSKQTHSVRSQKAKIMFSCVVCGKIFPDLGGLDWHATIHTRKQYTCTICGKGYFQKSDHKVHMQSHAEGTPFSSKVMAKVHMQSHSGGKRFSCTLCGNGYTLKVHMRTHAKGKK